MGEHNLKIALQIFCLQKTTPLRPQLHLTWEQTEVRCHFDMTTFHLIPG